jgi:hypothetical protein
MSAYWIGPYGVKVPFDVTHVPAADGGNTRFRDGTETERGVPRTMFLSRGKYLSKYAINRGTAEEPDWWYSDAYLQRTASTDYM